MSPRGLARPSPPQLDLGVAGQALLRTDRDFQIVDGPRPRHLLLRIATARFGLVRAVVARLLGTMCRLEAPAPLEAFVSCRRAVRHLFRASFVELDSRGRSGAVPVLVHRPAERVFLLSRDLEVGVDGSARVDQVRPVVPLVVPGPGLIVPGPQVVVLVHRPLVRVQRLRRFLGQASLRRRCSGGTRRSSSARRLSAASW